MKKMVLVILSLGLVGSAAWAGCTSDSSQVISVLKQFDSRVSEQSHATVKVKKDEPGQTVSLGDLLGVVKSACGSKSSASLTVFNPADNNKLIRISFSKRAGVVYATTSGRSTPVSL
jgi:hypothetical protein